MIKKWLVIAVFLVAIQFSAQAQTSEAAIRKVLATQVATWNEANIDAFMETYWKSDSLLFVGKNGPTYGWQNTLNNYKKSYATKEQMGKLNFDILQIKMLSADTYFVLGKWHLTRTVGDAGGFYTLLFKKFADGWKIVADHSS
jgi:ketosteroid isomerase-like protein